MHKMPKNICVYTEIVTLPNPQMFENITEYLNYFFSILRNVK